MEKTTYTQLTEQVKHYLGLYPHVGVALEAALEDVEGSGAIAVETHEAMVRINAGANDVEVLTEWSERVGAISLGTLANEIKVARAKGEDIGLYVNRHAIAAERKAQQASKRRKPFNRNRKPRNQ